jgi:deoxyadenosine/deoxycytidine kinase
MHIIETLYVVLSSIKTIKKGTVNMLIVVGGMIGLGKSSVAEVLGEALGSNVFYESVDDNPILPLFYTASPEEIQAKRYPFLLQLYFLDTRFKAIKQALVKDNNVLDRSIYEDWYFAKKNMELGRINELEMQVYESLLDNMMEELDELPKKAPDLMVYLKGSFETVLDRIMKRGRSFELDTELVDYYRFLWEGYDEWVINHYDASEVLIIDMDVIDVVEREEDKNKVIELVKEKLKEIRA